MKHYFQKNNEPGRHGSRSFYAAVGVCLIAVGVAAWTTYDSVVNYAQPITDEESGEDVRPANDTVSGIFATPSSGLPDAFGSMPEEPEPPASSSSEAESKPAQAEVTSKAPEQSSKPAASQPAKAVKAKVYSYTFPVSDAVVKAYSGSNPVFSNTMKDWRVHSGVDFDAKEGQDVRASADGVVKDVYTDALDGLVVCITHGEIDAYYCGLNSADVEKGEAVLSSQKIGVVGSVPCESEDGSHFHFAMKKDNSWVDPMTLLS